MNASDNTPTGSHENFVESKTIDYPFHQFIVKIQINESNQFLGITEISINKEFINYKLSSMHKEYHDVDEFYKD
jgi:hypothetical protein